MPVPVWRKTVDVKDIWTNFSTMPFEEARDEVVRRVEESGWPGNTLDADTLDNAIQGLKTAQGTPEFNAWWDVLYDIADVDRVWIETF